MSQEKASEQEDVKKRKGLMGDELNKNEEVMKIEQEVKDEVQEMKRHETQDMKSKEKVKRKKVEVKRQSG